MGWLFATRDSISVHRLSEEQKQHVIKELVTVSPGIFTPAHFAPRVGHTLNPDQEISARGDTFVSNSLGYRTGPVKK